MKEATKWLTATIVVVTAPMWGLPVLIFGLVSLVKREIFNDDSVA